MAHTTSKSTFNNPANPGLQTAKDAAGAMKETAGGMADTARGAAAAVAEKASDAASYLGKKAEDATSAVGSGMKSLAGTIRENMPHEGVLGSAGGAVANTLESGGRYLQEEGLSGMGEDVTDLIRRNPIPAVLIGIGVGFLLARATRS